MQDGLHRNTVDRIEQFWASHFGCPVSSLGSSGVTVVPCPADRSPWAFRYGNNTILSIPPALVEEIAREVKGQTGDVFSPAGLMKLFGIKPNQLVGPCFLGFCGNETFRPARASTCRMLESSDRPALERLATSCGSEWELGGIDERLQGEPVFGTFHDDSLTAAASYEIWGDVVAHVGFITHPAHRGVGLGTAVATGATANALERGLIPQWRTLESNLPSKAVARKVGFVKLASHYTLRIDKGLT